MQILCSFFLSTLSFPLSHFLFPPVWITAASSQSPLSTTSYWHLRKQGNQGLFSDINSKHNLIIQMLGMLTVKSSSWLSYPTLLVLYATYILKLKLLLGKILLHKGKFMVLAARNNWEKYYLHTQFPPYLTLFSLTPCLSNIHLSFTF